MKRSISVLLALLCILPLFACGSKDTAGDNSLSETETAETEPARIYLDNLPDDLNYDGETFRILWYSATDLAEEETGEVVNDAVYARDLSVETRLNCKLVSINEPYTWATREEYLNKIRSCVLANDGSYDIVSCQYATLPTLVGEGDFLDMAALPNLDFTQSYWVNQLIEETTIGGKLYLASGDITTNSLNSITCIFLNRTLMTNLKITDPSDLVYSGKWTHDAMLTMIANTYADLNGDGTKDVNDRFGLQCPTANYVTPFIQAYDIPITTMNKDGYPELSFGTEHVVEVAEAVHDMLWTNNAVIFGGEGSRLAAAADLTNNFKSGKTLMMVMVFAEMKTYVDMDDELGVLPLPKWDEEQEDYGTALNETNTLFGILVTTPNKEHTAAVMEMLASEGSRLVVPALYEINLKTRYATDPEFSKMLDLIRGSVIFNFGSVFCYDMGQINTFFKGQMGYENLTWMSNYDAKKEAVSKGIQDFIDKVKTFEQ